MSETPEHARLAPSAAYRWMNCPGSVALSEKLDPQPQSIYAAEGSAAHNIAALCLQMDVEPHIMRGVKIDLFECDAEMVDGVSMYVNLCLAVKTLAGGAECEIEQRLEVLPGVWGTADFVCYGKRLTVVDFKYGAGVAVEVKDNPQLLTYAVGAAKRMHNRGFDDVELIIVQPRAYHVDGPVRRWIVDKDTLEQFEFDLVCATEEVKDEKAALVPGDWCKWCPAAAICGELEQEINETVEIGESMVLNDTANYSPQHLASLLKRLPMIKDYIRSVERFAENEANAGRMPPGYKFVWKRSHRQWTNQSVALDSLRLLLPDEDLLEPASLRSPSQIEKALPPKERGLIRQLSNSPQKTRELAPVEDPRPSADPASGFEPMAEAAE